MKVLLGQSSCDFTYLRELLFADDSYAGGQPHDTDLLLDQAWEIASDGTLGDRDLGYPVTCPQAR